MDMTDRIIEIIKGRGPSIPSDVSKPVGIDTLFAGAHLSQMVESKKLKITSIKKGGSPFYYLPGQEELLLNLVNLLDAKEKPVFEFLKKSGILKDSGLSAQTKFALQTMKDFAIPINVTVNGSKELFWKFFLLSESETRDIIKDLLAKDKEAKEKAEAEEKAKAKEAKKQKKLEEQALVQKKLDTELIQVSPVETIKSKKESKKKTVFGDLDADIMDKVKELIKQEMQKKADMIPPAPVVKKPEDEADEFFKSVFVKFKERNMNVVEYEITKENSEFECIVSVPSAIGSSELFCRARNKKRFTDGDLSSVFVKGQSKKLNALFVGPGELTKKAQEVLDSEFKNKVFFFKV